MSTVKDPIAAAMVDRLLCDRCGQSRVSVPPSCTCLRYLQQAVRRRPDTVARAA